MCILLYVQCIFYDHCVWSFCHYWGFFSEYRSTKSIFLSDMRSMKLDISTNYSLGFLITANITRYLTIDDINTSKKKLEKICNLYFLLFSGVELIFARTRYQMNWGYKATPGFKYTLNLHCCFKTKVRSHMLISSNKKQSQFCFKGLRLHALENYFNVVTSVR